MALHDTRPKQESQAVKDLAIKLLLERELIIRLRKYFSLMSARFETLYAENGLILDTDGFNEELNRIIFDQYRKTSDKFQNQLLNHEDISEEIRKDQAMLDRINIAIEHSNLFEVGQSVRQIAKTNRKKSHKAVRDVLIASAIGGLALSRSEIAKRAMIRFRADGFARINTIAMSETQNAAESTKYIEASHLDKKKKDKAPMLKTWVAVLDEKTRTSHAEADGQTVIISDPFIVQGEELVRPRDTSLGASASNTINCRCAGIYHAQGEKVE